MEPEHTPPPVVPHAEFKAMALLALTILLVTGFIAYVMVARGVFESTQQLVLLAEDSEGVNVGMNVTFSGFPIGRVRRTELAADGKVRILVDVPTKDAHWLRSSTVFTLERGLVGDTKIRAFSGNLDDPALPDQAIRAVHSGDINAQIPRLVATMRGLLENLEKMSGAESDLNASFGNVHALTDRMKGKYGALSAVLGSDEHARKMLTAVDRGNALLAKTDQRVYGAGGLMDETQKSVVQLNALLRDARDSLKKADAVLVEAQAIGANARTATADLDVLRAEVEASLRKVGHLVEEINRKWPFARDAEIKLP
jgi:phospholipid/cholesterol/gamma-HCH transport system substrate-binding protein